MGIVVCGAVKGGVGKSTIATQVSALRALSHGDVFLYDTDKQKSSLEWCSHRKKMGIEPDIPFGGSYGRTVAEKIEAKSIAEDRDGNRPYKWLIVDTPGRDSVELRASLTVASHLIYPVSTGNFDRATLSQMSFLVEQTLEYNPNLKVSAVISNADHNRPKEWQKMREELNAFPSLPFSGVVIRRYAVLNNSFESYLSVVEDKKKSAGAHEDICSLYKLIFGEEYIGVGADTVHV